MKPNRIPTLLSTLAALYLACLPLQAAETQISNSPISGASSVDIAPNILFAMDDSTSMEWDYLPDWANVTELYKSRNASFNGVAYNPKVRYKPPVFFNADGSANTTTYPSQTNPASVKNDGYGIQDTASIDLRTSAFYYVTVPGEYCTNATLKNCTTASAATGSYTVAAPLRWCKTAADAAAATPSSGACQATQIDPVYQFWCDTAASAAAVSRPASCQASRDNGHTFGREPSNTPYNYPRMPAPKISSLTLSGSSSTSITNITVDSKQIMSAATTASGTPSVVAQAIVDQINACTYQQTGNCQTVGFSALISPSNSSVVIIFAPTATSSTPSITKSGTLSTSATAFAAPADNQAPGSVLMTVVTSTQTSYTKAEGRSDCTGTSCTYTEEMTNFSNWWAYYRTRMQTMKTATSLSFEPIDDKFRVGFMSINNNTGTDFRNILAFNAAQKNAWYVKLFAANPRKTDGSTSNTPLRLALATAGRIYSKKVSTANGVTVNDPVQYYCQPNVTILSTDGYWNEAAGVKVDGSTAVGDQDGPGLESRPQLDGGSPQMQETREWTRRTSTYTQAKERQVTQRQKRTAQAQTSNYMTYTRSAQLQGKDLQWQEQTSQLQKRTKTQPQQSTTKQWQERTSVLMKQTGTLQISTSTLQYQDLNVQQYRTSQLQYQSGQLQQSTSQLQQRLTQVQKRTSSNGGVSWTGWSNVASCSPVTSGTNRAQCQTLATGSWSNVSSCTAASGTTVVTGAGTDSETTTYNTKSECQYTAWTAWTNTASCSATPQSSSSPYSVGTAIQCQTLWSGSWVNATGNCTSSSTMQCRYSAWTGWTTGSCTAAPQSSGSPYTVLTARECGNTWGAWTNATAKCVPSASRNCQYTNWTAWTNTSSCTWANQDNTVLTAVQCQTAWNNATVATSSCSTVSTGQNRVSCWYTNWTNWTNVASCTASPQSGTSPYSTLNAKECQYYWTNWTDVANCTATPNAVGCQYVWSNWSNASSCTYAYDNTECQYTAWTGWNNVASCAAANQSGSPNYTVGTARNCQLVDSNAWANAASCTATSTHSCQYVWGAWTLMSPGASCTTINASSAPNYTVTNPVACWNGWSGFTNTASCVADAITRCNYTWPNPWVNTNQCTEDTMTQCQTITSQDWTRDDNCVEGTNSGATTYCRDMNPDPVVVENNVESCTDGTNASGVQTVCETITQGPTDVVSCTAAERSAANNYTKITCPIRYTGATPDTLADVAEYYYKTDLRSSDLSNCSGGAVTVGASTVYNDVCTNDLKYPRQFMSTYTLGLGASGVMQYRADYLTATSGDFYSIAVPEEANPATGICPWQPYGTCNWPKPASNQQTNIDDLWHAAVNGRGTYFSAKDPSSLAAGISGALANIQKKDGAVAAVTVTSPNLVSGDNGIFEVSFTAGEWSGELVKRTINGATGAISSTALWSARTKLDAQGWSARSIYFFDSTQTSKLSLFTWSNLTSAQQDYFKQPNIDGLSQFCTSGTACLGSSAKTAASGEPLVNFLRGENTNEGSIPDLAKYFRVRNHKLGDIVNSEPIYVKAPPWKYSDYQYGDFKSAKASRTGMVYVGANDGMLHAFNAETGEESWAYIPSIILPTLYQLADKNYGAEGGHRFFVDGTLSMGDICTANCTAPATGTSTATWKTILVGGLGKGGKGFYALDVTDPASPKALWEFTHTNMGYSFGNPVITKLSNDVSATNGGTVSATAGTWVVLLTSGYNNHLNGGDGKGHLFIVKASTGQLIAQIDTNQGTTSTPSGLAKIAAWAEFPEYNNTADRAYGGDLMGNVWRFDINGKYGATGLEAQRMATLADTAGTAQPITSRPELGQTKGYPLVFLATGQLLGTDDLSTTQTQSIYGIKDKLDTTNYGSPRSDSTFVQQTLSTGTCASGNDYCTAGDPIITASKNSVDYSSKNGWYIDFINSGERVNTDMRLVLSTLILNTNRPTATACVPVGVSYSYYLDYLTGGYVKEGIGGFVSQKIGDSLSASPSVVRLQDGTIRELIRTDAPSTVSRLVPIAPASASTRRISWRELMNF